jgi:uncharacterized protein (TIGR00251 family)
MIRIRVHVKPASSRNELTINADGSWLIRLKAKPVEGEANKELIRFLSEQLNIAKSNINIEKGLSSPYKIIRIDGDTSTLPHQKTQ